MYPDILYVVWNRDGSLSYGRTPDGIGMYWYDEDEEDTAREDICEVRRVQYFDSHKEFDEWRYEREAEVI